MSNQLGNIFRKDLTPEQIEVIIPSYLDCITNLFIYARNLSTYAEVLTNERYLTKDNKRYFQEVKRDANIILNRLNSRFNAAELSKTDSQPFSDDVAMQILGIQNAVANMGDSERDLAEEFITMLSDASYNHSLTNYIKRLKKQKLKAV